MIPVPHSVYLVKDAHTKLQQPLRQGQFQPHQNYYLKIYSFGLTDFDPKYSHLVRLTSNLVEELSPAENKYVGVPLAVFRSFAFPSARGENGECVVTPQQEFYKITHLPPVARFEFSVLSRPKGLPPLEPNDLGFSQGFVHFAIFVNL